MFALNHVYKDQLALTGNASFKSNRNEQQEHLPDQIDQRVWSYMYGPGMQLFLQRVDDREASGISLFSAIERGHEEKLQAFEVQHETGRATL
jgi:hypothetical protein